MSRILAALLGGAAGAVALVGIIIISLWFCLSRRSISRTSETGSSDPSLQVGRNTEVELSLSGAGSFPSNSREARCFMLEELNLATKNFSDTSLIGEGKFGEVYKGLLRDGMIVAIKKRTGAPSQEFIIEDLNSEEDLWGNVLTLPDVYFMAEVILGQIWSQCSIASFHIVLANLPMVRYLSSIRHQNLVSLLGYCQENGQQMLIYEYIPYGSISSQLYGQFSNEKLEFKHRLQIALGAAKGLAHLHALSPPLVHKNFRTANVLVHENFIAKVADAGLRNLLGRVDVAGPSSQTTADDIFLAPEVREFGRFSERGDVYSFGVFLLELVSGREAQSGSSESDQSLVEWVQNYQDSSNVSAIIDHGLGNSFTAEGMKEFIQLTARCVDASSQRRPPMNYLVSELERIFEREVGMTTIMGEGTPTVTLGSQLFTASR